MPPIETSSSSAETPPLQALTLPARRGWHWLAEGYRIFRKNPPLLALLVISYWAMVALLNLLPVIGTLVAPLCVPALSVSLMNACRDIDEERGTRFPLIFSGFRRHPARLVALGAAYLAATLTILGIVYLIDDGTMFRFMILGQPPTDAEIDSSSVGIAAQVAMVLMAPVILANWYAPMLVAWHQVPPAKALFFSFVACLRNWRAFLTYGLANAGVIAVLAIVLGVLATLFPGWTDGIAALATVPLAFVLAPTLFASFYVSYRDVFGAPGDADS